MGDYWVDFKNPEGEKTWWRFRFYEKQENVKESLMGKLNEKYGEGCEIINYGLVRWSVFIDGVNYVEREKRNSKIGFGKLHFESRERANNQ